ncbi:hypothetical protein SAY86_004052 [Trapa natans]|uniref:Uncharacterized protein n=1 Tax=Trapa natans TaxID=22666 RepID=A0AAN7MY43_TRANT|nr:hypothetical protein SAY86_004052 [Trapa natans]
MPMETEDVLQPKSDKIASGFEGNESCGSGIRPSELDASPGMEDEEGLIREDLGQGEVKVENEDIVPIPGPDLDKDLIAKDSTAQANAGFIEVIEASESSQVLVQNGSTALEDHRQKTTHVRDENCILVIV